jgi:hypothetical protein
MIVWTAIKMILKGVLTQIINVLKALASFAKEHPRLTAAIVACILSAGGGWYFQKKMHDKEITELHAAYKARERLREAEIEERLKEIAKNSDAKVDELLKEIEKAKKEKAATLAMYHEEVKKRQERVKQLEVRLEELRKNGASKEELDKVAKELEEANKVYGLSPEAVQAINQLVRKLGK